MNQSEQESYVQPQRGSDLDVDVDPAPNESNLWIVRPDAPVEDPYSPKLHFSYEPGEAGKPILTGDFAILVGDEDTITGVGRFGVVELTEYSEWTVTLDRYLPVEDRTPVDNVLTVPDDFGETDFGAVADRSTTIQSLEAQGLASLEELPRVPPRPK